MRYLKTLTHTASLVAMTLVAGLAFADWQEGVDAFTSGDYAAAEDEFAAFAQSSPTAHAAFFMLGRCRLQMDDPDKAVESLRRAVVLDESNWQYRFTLGRTLVSAGEMKEAADVLEDPKAATIPEAYRVPVALLNAEIAAKSGNLTGAVEILEKRLAAGDSSSRLHMALGLTLRKSGELRRAYENLSRAYDLEPGNQDAARAAVQCALDLAETLADDDTSSAWVKKAAATAALLAESSASSRNLRLAGDAARLAGDYNAATGWYGNALSLEPEDPELAYDLALCFVRTDHDKKAKTLLENGLKMEPGADLGRSIHLQMARISARNLELDDAAAHFRLAGRPERAEEINTIASSIDSVLKERDKLKQTITELEEMLVSLEALNEQEGVEKMQHRITEYRQALVAIDANLNETRNALRQL